MDMVSKLVDGSNEINYTYNANGIRTGKTIDCTIETGEYYQKSYVLDEKKILKEIVTGSDSYILKYLYDENDSIVGFEYIKNNTIQKYQYLKNLQGDIVGILDINGNQVVKYYYNGYGELISIIDTSDNNIGSINPFRYKSYYYDTETGWYYLNSRYYNPFIGRFITMDDIYFLGSADLQNSYNMFCYSLNNPINYVDFSGNVPQLFINSITYSGVYDQITSKCTEIIDALKTTITILCAQLPVYLTRVKTATKAFITILKTAIRTAFAFIISATLLLAAIGTIIYAIKKIYDLATDLTILIEQIKSRGKLDPKKCEKNSVYVFDRSNYFIDVYYVGRTNDPIRRMGERWNSRLLEKMEHFKVVFTNLELNQARVMEQALITFYFSIKLKNAINSISHKNWKKFVKNERIYLL